MSITNGIITTALAYFGATGRAPPRRVNLRIKGPFFRLVDHCFRRMRISAGGIVDLINEREIRRKEIESLRHDRRVWLKGNAYKKFVPSHSQGRISRISATEPQHRRFG